jgi:mRNA interferase MazF
LKLAFARRGEVWLAGLDPVRGHEQGRERPVLVVSVDEINAGPSGLCVVIPITSTCRGIPGHVELALPEGGLYRRSFAMCEQIRCISQARLRRSFGLVSTGTLQQVENYLRIFLGL